MTTLPPLTNVELCESQVRVAIQRWQNGWGSLDAVVQAQRALESAKMKAGIKA